MKGKIGGRHAHSFRGSFSWAVFSFHLQGINGGDLGDLVMERGRGEKYVVG